MKTPIFHICSEAAWHEARKTGVYEGSELDRRDGFIHFSSPEQVRQTAALHLRGIEGLVLLEVDPARLGDDLKWEISRDGAAFPHLYAALPVSAVTRTWALPVGPDGLHAFPPDIP